MIATRPLKVAPRAGWTSPPGPNRRRPTDFAPRASVPLSGANCLLIIGHDTRSHVATLGETKLNRLVRARASHVDGGLGHVKRVRAAARRAIKPNQHWLLLFPSIRSSQEEVPADPTPGRLRKASASWLAKQKLLNENRGFSNNKQGITNYLKSVEGLSDVKYRREIRDLNKVLSVEWKEIEREFISKRKKY